MKSFEVVREQAAELHSKLIQSGANPENPESLIEKAIEHYDLELTYLAPADPTLKGAKALLDEQSGTICVANIGTPAGKALVIAHEIGHLVAHAHSFSCAEHDIDASRSTEAAPVGLQRVEDYGARERKELEANVFARELLLPRSLAAQWFLKDGRNAASIAAASGLPLPVVRQQILDAVLLPKAIIEEKASAASFKDDPVQNSAAAHRDAPYQLRAGPGTGKTRSLVSRVKSLLDDSVQASAILVLTFSNRTASELTERLTATAPDQAAAIWVGTFHGFGLEMVRRFHNKLGLPPNPTLFDRSDAIAVLEDILPTLPLKHYKNLWNPVVVLKEILQAISRAKDEVVSATDYRGLAEAQHAKALSSDDPDAIEVAEKLLEIAAVYDLYEEAKAGKQAVDFGDLIMLPTLLLERDEQVRATTRLRHRHLLVDEYQDVNRASVRLVKSLAGDGKNLWVVGDARQSIYRFRGASSSNMASFGGDFAGAVFEPLEVNYRSTQKVIDAFSLFARGMPLPPELTALKLKANRGPGTDIPEVRGFTAESDEALGIAASIKELERAGVALRDQAILCRTNPRLSEIAKVLEDCGIPVLHLGSLFERDEIRDLLSLLTLATDRLGSGLVRICTSKRYGAPLQDVKTMLEHLRDGDKVVLLRLDELAALPGISSAGATAIRRLAEDCAGLTPSKDPWDFLTTILLDRSDLLHDIGRSDEVKDRMRGIALWQFLNFLRERSPVPKGSPIFTVLERVRNLVLLAEERDLRQVPEAALQMNAVRLMTIHTSKGLEFEAVHVPGLIKTGLPSNYRGMRCPPPDEMVRDASGSAAQQSREAHEQEEECLFFVAMSRARTYLRIYFTRMQDGGAARKPSPFLERIAAKSSLIDSGPQLPPPIQKKVAGGKITFAKDWVLTDRRFKSYEDCPTRFFYTHILGIGSARRSTAFERTHSCIYDLISWLSEGRLTSSPTREETHAAFDVIWKQKGPTDGAYASDYLNLARRLVDGLVDTGAGRRFREAKPLAIDFANGRILVEAAEIAERAGGIVALRRILSGHRGSQEFDKLEYFLFQRAAAQHFGVQSIVEVVHLTDNDMVDVPALTDRQVKNRVQKTEAILSGINGRDFAPVQDAFTCPRCPHFFICAATPDGDLILE